MGAIVLALICLRAYLLDLRLKLVDSFTVLVLSELEQIRQSGR